MSTGRVILTERARELETFRISMSFKDEFGASVPLASFTTLTLTLFNDADGEVLNNLNNASILNTGRGVVDAAGVLTCTLLPDDNPIVDLSLLEELHVAFVRWTYGGGKAGGIEVAFYIRNFAKSP